MNVTASPMLSEVRKFGSSEVQHVSKEGNRFAAARRAENDVAESLNPSVGRLEDPIERIISKQSS